MNRKLLGVFVVLATSVLTLPSAVAVAASGTGFTKSAAERDFVKLATASCELAMAKGVTEVMGQVTVKYQPMKTDAGFYDHTAVATGSDGKTAQNPFDFWQPLCFPKKLADSYTNSHQTMYPGLEHKFAKINASTFTWAQHMGSQDLTTVTYTVKNGRIVTFLGGSWQLTKVLYGK